MRTQKENTGRLGLGKRNHLEKLNATGSIISVNYIPFGKGCNHSGISDLEHCHQESEKQFPYSEQNQRGVERNDPILPCAWLNFGFHTRYRVIQGSYLVTHLAKFLPLQSLDKEEAE